MRSVSLAIVILLLPFTVAPAQPTFVPDHDPTPTNSQWRLVDEMSDEFDGDSLDHGKWQTEPLANGWGWEGRPPALFHGRNAVVRDGRMNVTVSKLEGPVVSRGKTFTYQGAIIRSLSAGQPGWYYECRMKANQTVMSSTFWLMTKGSGDKRLEFDIQECVGRTTDKTEPWATEWDRIFHSNAIHRVSRGNPTKVQLQGQKLTETRNWQRFYVYGAWWKSPRELRFYLDGEYAYSIYPKVDWDVPSYLQMAIETYDWNPVPEDDCLIETGDWEQRTTKYDWVRTWRLVDRQPGE
ncbi:MAG: glycosyl hydrolase [Planctomycetota bacterium]